MPNTRFKGVSNLGYRGDAILQMDDTVGRIMRLLDYLNIQDKTMLIFSSDNGPILDDGYVDVAVKQNSDHQASGIYRSGKYSIFEGGTRIPLIISWPEMISKNTTTNALIGQVDFLASFSDYFNQNLQNDDALDSYDLWSTLIGVDKIGRVSLIEDATIDMIDASAQSLLM